MKYSEAIAMFKKASADRAEDALADATGTTGRSAGTSIGLLASALSYKPARSFANSIGKNGARRHGAARSGKPEPGKGAAA